MHGEPPARERRRGWGLPRPGGARRRGQRAVHQVARSGRAKVLRNALTFADEGHRQLVSQQGGERRPEPGRLVELGQDAAGQLVAAESVHDLVHDLALHVRRHHEVALQLGDLAELARLLDQPEVVLPHPGRIDDDQAAVIELRKLVRQFSGRARLPHRQAEQQAEGSELALGADAKIIGADERHGLAAVAQAGACRELGGGGRLAHARRADQRDDVPLLDGIRCGHRQSLGQPNCASRQASPGVARLVVPAATPRATASSKPALTRRRAISARTGSRRS
jgi:hypothetical protein